MSEKKSHTKVGFLVKYVSSPLKLEAVITLIHLYKIVFQIYHFSPPRNEKIIVVNITNIRDPTFVVISSKNFEMGLS